jgi:hypothetical protein
MESSGSPVSRFSCGRGSGDTAPASFVFVKNITFGFCAVNMNWPFQPQFAVAISPKLLISLGKFHKMRYKRQPDFVSDFRRPPDRPRPNPSKSDLKASVTHFCLKCPENVALRENTAVAQQMPDRHELRKSPDGQDFQRLAASRRETVKQ